METTTHHWSRPTGSSEFRATTSNRHRASSSPPSRFQSEVLALSLSCAPWWISGHSTGTLPSSSADPEKCSAMCHGPKMMEDEGRAATGMYFARKRAGRASSMCSRCDARACIVFERSVAPGVSRRCRGFSSRLRIAQDVARCGGVVVQGFVVWSPVRGLSPGVGAARSCRLPRTVALGPTLSSAEVRVPAVAPGLSPQLRVVKGAERVAGRRVPAFRSHQCVGLVSVRHGGRRDGLGRRRHVSLHLWGCPVGAASNMISRVSKWRERPVGFLLLQAHGVSGVHLERR